MQTAELTKIIEEQRLTLENTSDPTEAFNILYNIIRLSKVIGKSDDNYRLTKKFFVNYVESIKTANYGYDNFNYLKLEKLFVELNINERISILEFSITTVSRELPELDTHWFLDLKHQYEIDRIFSQREVANYPKGILLYCGRNLPRLFVTLCVLVAFSYVVLLPAPAPCMEVFRIKYEIYVDNYWLNHFVNILGLFADIDSDFEIKPVGFWGAIVLIVSKLSFIVLIVNFVYIRLSDKIAVK